MLGVWVTIPPLLLLANAGLAPSGVGEYSSRRLSKAGPRLPALPISADAMIKTELAVWVLGGGVVANARQDLTEVRCYSTNSLGHAFSPGGGYWEGYWEAIERRDVHWARAYQIYKRLSTLGLRTSYLVS